MRENGTTKKNEEGMSQWIRVRGVVHLWCPTVTPPLKSELCDTL